MKTIEEAHIEFNEEFGFVVDWSGSKSFGQFAFWRETDRGEPTLRADPECMHRKTVLAALEKALEGKQKDSWPVLMKGFADPEAFVNACLPHYPNEPVQKWKDLQ